METIDVHIFFLFWGGGEFGMGDVNNFDDLDLEITQELMLSVLQ